MEKCALYDEKDDKSHVILDSQSIKWQREIKKNIIIIENFKKQVLLAIVEDDKNLSEKVEMKKNKIF